MTKQNPHNIRVGDIVRIDSLDEADDGTMGRVTHVTERWNSDLLKYQPVTVTDKYYFTKHHESERLCGVSLAHLVRRAPYVLQGERVLPPKPHPFKGDNIKHKGIPHVYVGGFLQETVELILWKMGVPMPYGVDRAKVYPLWEKAQFPGKRGMLPGQRESHYDHYNHTLNCKHFERWVRNNAQRLIKSKRVWIEEEKAYAKEQEERYKEDMDWIDEIYHSSNDHDEDEVVLYTPGQLQTMTAAELQKEWSIQCSIHDRGVDTRPMGDIVIENAADRMEMIEIEWHRRELPPYGYCEDPADTASKT